MFACPFVGRAIVGKLPFSLHRKLDYYLCYKKWRKQVHGHLNMLEPKSKHFFSLNVRPKRRVEKNGLPRSIEETWPIFLFFMKASYFTVKSRASIRTALLPIQVYGNANAAEVAQLYQQWVLNDLQNVLNVCQEQHAFAFEPHWHPVLSVNAGTGSTIMHLSFVVHFNMALYLLSIITNNAFILIPSLYDCLIQNLFLLSHLYSTHKIL